MSLGRHTAAGTNAAFSYQFERALFWLASSRAGFVVGIETDDDVSVRGDDGSRVLEQDKHSTAEAARPFGDRSKDLWNTLVIWVRALDSEEVPSGTRFLMVTNKTVPECLARRIGAAATEEDVAACIEGLVDAAEDPPSHVAPLMRAVLDPRYRASLSTVIERAEFIDAADASAGEALRKVTIAELPLPQWCEASASSIVDELLGWLHSTALAKWQQGVPAWFARDHLVNQLHAILDRRKRELSRERAENLIPVTDEHIGAERGRFFVKQIYLVADDEFADLAIKDFIRCGIEMLRLSADGNVTDDDWKAFEATLKSRWTRIRARALRMASGRKEEEVGFEILTETTEDWREKLAGVETEQIYLTSGTYHRLADSGDVGWHPRYPELLGLSKGKP